MALRGRSKYLIFWSPKERKTGREGEKRKGEEERRRRGRAEEEQAKPSSKKVWNFGFVYGTNLDYGFYEIWHGSLGLYDD